MLAMDRNISILHTMNSDIDNNLTVSSIDSNDARQIHNAIYMTENLAESQHLVPQKRIDRKDYHKYNFIDRSLEKIKFYCGGYTRYLILLLSVLCMTAARSNELAFNFNVICMTSNHSLSDLHEPIEMTPNEMSAIFAGGGIGAIIMVIPVVYAIHHLGALTVFSILLILSSVATILMSFVARIDVLYMVPARIIQGLAMASVMPMMGVVSANWAPLKEIGNFMTLLSSSGQLSQLLTMPMAAHLCVEKGWASVFHAHGFISLSLVILFVIFFRESPRKHPLVGREERDYITEGLKKPNKKDRTIPYGKIFRCKAIWGIWISFLASSFGFQVFLQFMPTYLNKVLHVPIHQTGFSAIIPAICQLVAKLIVGVLSDKITFISERLKLQLFNTIALVGCASFLLPLGFLHHSQSSLALFLFTAAISCLGLIAVGAMKSATLVARSFTHFVMAIIQLVNCIGMLLIPIIVSYFAPNNTIEEWRNVFIVIFIILILGNGIFVSICSATPESWAFMRTESQPQSILKGQLKCFIQKQNNLKEEI
ncbi:Major facilitator superfamily and Major facilitator superfamily domain, general substrate transporter and Major facilitator superfamily domain-containing protein [Strongyloides ratti]|uniref:Major facilitator superfamily and Major facilitator superfamily domain, general substrate transporter and Major facilitator superfamily domain-containing protein n=1 Tax=Strongyloides ratti TaxID=34506 RepID=A0A090KYI8_STRRB|nr:Major facilitator superfamily and Major facilitator superfamily domain, general substrate transporter and Major facilitator superfamily domain-containing protein [Strongyloides ratti]CEF62506.1 Major facilitator superfamily and Major facilitator superfamily domain, general substrate transporter and Major facilitator superfamily domain-containing protein [Strongyloides ratti]